MEIEVYLDYKRIPTTIMLDVTRVRIKRGIAHKHILSINDIDYKIQFYAPTWVYNGGDPKVWEEWNKHCGKLRGKRYIHLYKKKNILHQLLYIKHIMKLGGCYLILIK